MREPRAPQPGAAPAGGVKDISRDTVHHPRPRARVSSCPRGPRSIRFCPTRGERWGGRGPPLRRDARHGEVERLLRTTTRTPHGARLTYPVDDHIAAWTPFVVEYPDHRMSTCLGGLTVVFRPVNVGRVVVLTDPSARGFRAAAAGSRADTMGPAAAAAAAAGAAEGVGTLGGGS